MEHEINRTNELLERLEPIVQRYLDKMLDQEGVSITISVSTNLATSMVAMCILMIMHRKGAHAEYVSAMAEQINDKVGSALAAKVQAGHSTCQKLH